MTARVMLAAYWKIASMRSLKDWIDKAWHMTFMHKLTTIVKIRECDRKAKSDFQNTWKLFLDLLARLDSNKKNQL